MLLCRCFTDLIRETVKPADLPVMNAKKSYVKPAELPVMNAKEKCFSYINSLIPANVSESGVDDIAEQEVDDMAGQEVNNNDMEAQEVEAMAGQRAEVMVGQGAHDMAGQGEKDIAGQGEDMTGQGEEDMARHGEEEDMAGQGGDDMAGQGVDDMAGQEVYDAQMQMMDASVIQILHPGYHQSEGHDDDQVAVREVYSPHCEVENCYEEVFAACATCLIFMCHDHFVIDYQSCAEHNSLLQVNCSDFTTNREQDTVDNGTKVCDPVAIHSDEENGDEDDHGDDDDDDDDDETIVMNYAHIRPLKKRQTAKDCRLKGHSYTGYSRSKTGIVVQEVERQKRAIKPRCKHTKMVSAISSRSLLCGHVSDKSRLQTFTEFWQLDSWAAKKAFIRGLIDTRQAIRRRKSEISVKEKKDMHDCFLRKDDGGRVLVCKSLFLDTLCIGENQFRRWTKPCTLTKDTDATAPQGRTARKDNSRRKDVTEWLNQLPKVPSHYCRSSSKRTYVESTFRSLNHMHEVYVSYMQSENKQVVSRQIFVEVVKDMKIAIHTPRKDQCDTCCEYKTGNLSQEEYAAHIIKKDEAHTAKKAAKEQASGGTVVVTMDLQSVLLAPRLRASAVYYKQKLQLHNFTIYRLNDGQVDLYVWHEGNGGVGANEFVTCITNYITNLPATTERVILISDGCGYQNRNRVLSSALSNLAAKRNVIIEQLILEKGHTMMEADSVHSTLEQVIYLTHYKCTV